MGSDLWVLGFDSAPDGFASYIFVEFHEKSDCQKMKVAYINRHRRAGTFSIEKVFDIVRAELARRNDVSVANFEHNPFRNILGQVFELWRMKADVYHVVGDVHYYAFMLPWRKTVLTVHDIRHYEEDLRGIKKWLYKILWLTLPLRAAAAVTVISDETRKTLLKYFPFVRGKVVVIGDPSNPGFGFVRKEFNSECPVILQVGAAKHKNILRLAEALKGIRCRLVIVGKPDLETVTFLKDNSISFELLNNLSDEDIRKQYEMCDLVSFVSTYEGFGVPIIEANASGRPVITSNLPPMSAVAGSGSCLVNPFQVSEIKAGILKIIQDKSYRDMLVASGLENCKRFSPETITAEYFLVYSGLATHASA